MGCVCGGGGGGGGGNSDKDESSLDDDKGNKRRATLLSVYVIIAIFCVAGVNGLFHAALPLWRRAFPCESKLPVSRVPCMSAPPRIVSLGLFLLCVGFVATWVVFRHAT